MKALIVTALEEREQALYQSLALEEMRELAETAGYEVVDMVILHIRSIEPKTYIGSGKVEELAEFYETSQLDAVICYQELSPSQVSSLMEVLNCEVFTRTELILRIFALHARTKIAKIQVELAQVKYMLTRLTGKGVEMSRIRGGIGMRGPGEQKLEMDRRFLRRRIHLLTEKLEQLEKGMLERRKKRRKQQKSVAIIGYTNAGKSSLLNVLTHEDVLVEDKLFATLDTTSRRLWLAGKKGEAQIVLTDTVGFIQDLPHTLVESFRSTLLETVDTDLLLHVVNSAHPAYLQQIETVQETLKEINAENIPQILCFNKIDLLSTETYLQLRREFPKAYFISTRTKENLSLLREALYDFFIEKEVENS